MSTIKTIKWPLKPHTRAKHLILKSYLDAWIPILTSWNSKVIYIDGFAGPGEYEGGEDGSPVIAIKSVINHKIKIKSEIVMIFIEANKERCQSLKKKINSMEIPPNIKPQFYCNEFSEILTNIFKYLDEQKKRIAPSFVFIDPFGFKGIPFEVIKRIMENPKCEVFITFMLEGINRFMSKPEIYKTLSETFGSNKWKKALDLKDPREKLSLLGNIYRKQLEEIARIRYVIEFSMINEFNKYDYLLFFGSNHLEGLKAMKRAMWRADPLGNFRFSDFTFNPNQGLLIEPKPDLDKLKEVILPEFKDKVITFDQLSEFVWTKTSFLETHLRQLLISMQKTDPPIIKILSGEKRKINAFKPYYQIKFL